jgi:hypothetical protein
MNVRIDLNEPKILEKVQNDRFGLLVSNEWKRLIDPYTPRDTGIMQETAKVLPWKIHYIQPYSSAVYYGRGKKFQKKNPYSTFEWDVAADRAGQGDKLNRTINNALQSGQF